MKNSFIYYSFPYAETVVYLDSLRPNEKVSKNIIWVLIVCMQLLIIFRNTNFVGSEMFHISCSLLCCP